MKKPVPRPVTAWATMDKRTRQLSQVYVGGYNKTYVAGDCSDEETVVRVRIVPILPPT